MQTQNLYKPTYWLWEDGLKAEFCDLAIKQMQDMPEHKTGMGADGHENKDIRDSKIVFAEHNYWLEGILFNYARYANKSAGWNYSANEPEQVQIAKYTKNNHYDWHEDWDPLAIGSDLKLRKLSIVALLSDQSEFEGGLFQIKNEHFEDETLSLKKGSVLVFPSFITHRVTPVISGCRYSAVCWVNGHNTL